MKLFGNKAAKVLLDRTTQQLLELEATKKRLEINLEQIGLDLANQKRKMEMTLEEERHKNKLALNEKSSLFEQDKKIWEKEKKELIERYERERKEFEERLNKDTELKLQEAVTLTKLESQQKIAQAELDKEREVNNVKVEMAQRIAKIQEEESVKHYSKLQTAFVDMQTNGDKNTKFVQDLALRILDKTPTSRVDLNVDTTPQLVSTKEQ